MIHSLRHLRSLSIQNFSFFLLLLIVFTFVFMFWFNQEIQHEITSLHRELDRTTQFTQNVLDRRTLEQLQGNEVAAIPLNPVPFNKHPSPFTSHELTTYQRQYTLQTYYDSNDISKQAEIIVGYSNVTLSGGTSGDQYFSVLAWMPTAKLELFSNTNVTQSRNNYMWLVYQGGSGELQSVYLSFQAAPTGSRVSEISGFLAPSLGETDFLRRDSTIKGSVFKSPDNNSLIFSFRMRVKSLQKVPRPDIDVTHPIGLQFYLSGASSKININTFKLENGKIRDVPHLTGTSIKKALATQSVDVQSVTLIDVDGNEVSLLFRDYLPYKASNFLKRWLWSMIGGVVSDSFGGIIPNGDSFLIFDDDSLQLLGREQMPMTLRVAFDPHDQLNLAVENLWQLIIFYILFVVSLILILVVIHFHVIRRIVQLTLALDRFDDGDDLALKKAETQVNDEIGQLARFLQTTIRKLDSARSLIESRYKSRAELMSIMGHDVRTPVAALLSLHKDDDETLRYIKRIERASTEILKAAKIDDAHIEGKYIKPVDAGEFFSTMVNSLKNMFEGKVHYVPPEDQIIIEADKEMLEDVVDEIIHNAMDFAKNITIEVTREENRGRVEIFNDGKHIDESVIGTIFDYGVSDRGELDSEHHGIGLFSVAWRIRILKSEISAENRERGVAFIIYLPLTGE